MSTEMVHVEDAMNLGLVGDPAKIIENATKACTVLMEIVKKRKLYEDIGKARHLKVEAWLTLAHFYGVTVRTVSVFSVHDEMTSAAGFEATVEAVHLASGRVIGQAVARCINNEPNWGIRPKYEGKGGDRKVVGEAAVASYQLESMAQTRATSKVLASLLRWVVVLGGGNIEGTPAEEMGGTQESHQQQERSGESGKRISEGQRKRIFGKAKEHGFPLNDLPGLLAKYGFKIASEVTIDKYDALVAEVEAWNQNQAAAS